MGPVVGTAVVVVQGVVVGHGVVVGGGVSVGKGVVVSIKQHCETEHPVSLEHVTSKDLGIKE